jgi:hypothetical protein
MTPKQFVKHYKKYGSVKLVAKGTGITYYKARKAYIHAVADGLMDAQSVGRKSREQIKAPEPIFQGQQKAPRPTEFAVPKKGVKTYILTSAQNNTKLHEGLWKNLLALRKFYGAKLMVGRYTYIKCGLGEGGDKARFVAMQDESLYDSKIVAWDPRIEPYVVDERVELAPGLVWCGEWQRLPTVKRPLSGFETYTGRKSGIFPHAKFEMQSVASSKFEATKFNYTTGTTTMRNYIVKGAGLSATFHHGYGAVLVEVDKDGDWFVRQLNADSDGTIYDLDLKVEGGETSHGHRPEGVTWGDIHVQERDPVVEKLSGDLMNILSPKYAFYHDVLNFGSRNHHDIKDPFKKLKLFHSGLEDVRFEVGEAMCYVVNKATAWPNTEHVVVDSNHDRALERWLRESDWRHDPINMEFFMESALAKIKSIRSGDDTFHMMRYWFNDYDYQGDNCLTNVRFLDEDESFVLCEDANGGIECGMHGHLGPNGSRGGAAAFAKMGRKANVGHTHQAGIYDGIFTAGTSSSLDMGYNRGPSSWSHSHILTYPNGKRTIITMWNGKWRAGMRRIKA